jgi:hypothetical protein
MTLARTPAPPVVVQREEAEAATPPAAAPAAGQAPAAAQGVDTAKLAEQVFSMLERRLVVERERGGLR